LISLALVGITEKGERDTHNLACMAYDGPTIHSMPLAYGYPPASA
jgi:hypothetical protein